MILRYAKQSKGSLESNFQMLIYQIRGNLKPEMVMAIPSQASLTSEEGVETRR